jgi:putative cell wall-binding protein
MTLSTSRSMTHRCRLVPVAAGVAGLAVVAATAFGGAAANAATTTVTVPKSPFSVDVSGNWNGDAPTVPVGATSIRFVLPDSLANSAITSASWTLTPDGGSDITGTAPVAADHSMTVQIPANTLVDGAKESIQLFGSADSESSATPSPYDDVSSWFNVTVAFVPTNSATTNDIDLNSAAAGHGYGSTTDYWAAPASPLTVRPGDSVVLQAPDDTLFSGDTTAEIYASDGSWFDPMTTSLSEDGTTLTLTLPAGSDVSNLAGEDTQLEVTTDVPSSIADSFGDSLSVGVPLSVAGADGKPVVTRVSGTDRYSTSVALAKKGWPNGSYDVYVATGANFPDALGAASAATYEGGPLLLTDPSTLPSVVADEIRALNPGEIKVVGGTAAVSDNVLRSLKQIAPTQRLAGSSRYETDQSVILDAFGSSASEVYVATGTNYPDALSASAAAGAAGDPVILVNGSAPSLDAETATFLKQLGANSFRVAGGTSAVSAGIASDLSKLGTVSRYAGASRYETSQLINASQFSNPTHVYAATGTGFADALSGAVLAGAKQSPLYVVQPGCVPTGDVATFGSAAAVTLIGGTNALNANVANIGACS